VRQRHGRWERVRRNPERWLESAICRPRTTVEPWIPPDKWAGLGHHILNLMLTDIEAGLPDGNRYTDERNAKDRAAWKVIVKHAPDKTEAQAKEIIKAWRKTGLLISKDYDNPETYKKVKGLWVDNSKRPS
jgi:hypothetical protein